MKYGTWPTWPTFFRWFGGPRRLDRTLRKGKTVRVEPSSPDEMMRTGEVGQLRQLHPYAKAYEIRNLANFANFFFDVLVGGPKRLRVVVGE